MILETPEPPTLIPQSDFPWKRIELVISLSSDTFSVTS